MRILLMTEASSAGVGRHVLDLAEGLLQGGYRVHLIYSGLRIDRTFSERLSALSEMAQSRLDMRRAPHVSDLSAIRRTRAYLRRQGPFDVIHAHSSKAGLIARLSAVGNDGAVVYTPHCPYTMNPTLGPLAYRLGRTIERTLSGRTDTIIAVSPDERDHLIEIGIRAELVKCIPNGVDFSSWGDKGEARRRLGLPRHGVGLGFIGRLSEQKDPVMLLRAFARLAAEREDVYLAMVGTGPLETEARGVANDLGIDHRVFWLGYRTAREVMPAFDMLVMPSRYEAMPYVLLEALSAGLPIVSTRVGGAALTIDHGSNGYLIDSRAPESLADALRPLIESPSLRERFSEASRRASFRFTVSEMVEQTHALYCRLTQQSHAMSISEELVPLPMHGGEAHVSLTETISVES